MNRPWHPHKQNFTIYSVTFTGGTLSKYIGITTMSPNIRFSAHRCSLAKGKHHAPLLQDMYNKMGADKLQFNIELKGEGTPYEINKAENDVLARYKEEGIRILNYKQYSGYGIRSCLKQSDRKKKKFYYDRCAKMRAGKERKRLEQNYAPHPDRPMLCMRVIVKEFECTEPKATTYHLQACPARRDSYWIWEGKTRWPKPMGKATFFRSLYEKHPRMMPQEDE